MPTEKFKKIFISPFTWLIAGLMLLHLAPIWAFPYFPTQDGPSHLENSFMLRHYFDPDRNYQHYYYLNLKFYPNWFSQAALFVLMSFVPPLIAEKILVTFFMLVWILSFSYFLRSFGREKFFHILWVFPFLYNYFLHMGFYNFYFSIPVAYFIIGYWWRHRDSKRKFKVLLKLNALMVFLYLCHFHSFIVAIISLCLLNLLDRRKVLLSRIKTIACLFPAYFLALYYLFNSWIAAGGDWAWAKWDYLFGFQFLISYEQDRKILAATLAILFAVVFIYTIVRERLNLSGKKVRWVPSVNDQLVITAILFICIYFLVPTSITRSGDYIKDRMSIYPFLFLFPVLTMQFERFSKNLLALSLVIISCFNIWIMFNNYKEINSGLSEFNSAQYLINKNDVILPITFYDSGGNANLVRPYLHGTGYYCIAKGAIELDNYQGNRHYFPFIYRHHLNPYPYMKGLELGTETAQVNPQNYPEPIPYILIWNPPDQFSDKNWIESNYRLIHSQGRVRLYQLNQAL